MCILLLFTNNLLPMIPKERISKSHFKNIDKIINSYGNQLITYDVLWQFWISKSRFTFVLLAFHIYIPYVNTITLTGQPTVETAIHYMYSSSLNHTLKQKCAFHKYIVKYCSLLYTVLTYMNLKSIEIKRLNCKYKSFIHYNW